MGYNISTVQTLKLDATMKASSILTLIRDYEERLPSGCFVKSMERVAVSALAELGPEAEVPIKRFEWSGEGTGWSFDFLKESVAPLIKGRVEVIFTWEGGDSHSGMIIQDGVVTECDVQMVLVPKVAS